MERKDNIHLEIDFYLEIVQQIKKKIYSLPQYLLTKEELLYLMD